MSFFWYILDFKQRFMLLIDSLCTFYYVSMQLCFSLVPEFHTDGGKFGNGFSEIEFRETNIT